MKGAQIRMAEVVARVLHCKGALLLLCWADRCGRGSSSTPTRYHEQEQGEEQEEREQEQEQNE